MTTDSPAMSNPPGCLAAVDVPCQAMLFTGSVASAIAITTWANSFPELVEEEPNASCCFHDGIATTDDLLIAVGDENVPVPVGAWVIYANGFQILEGAPRPLLEKTPTLRELAGGVMLVEKPGDTLIDNVTALLDACPYTVRDVSGERTKIRGQEDLIGSLAITFMAMQNRLSEGNGTAR